MKKQLLFTLAAILVILTVCAVDYHEATSKKIVSLEGKLKESNESQDDLRDEIRGLRNKLEATERNLSNTEAKLLERQMNDIEWVKNQSSLPIYDRFITKFPNHPEIPLLRKRIIDLEVKKIAAGKYGKMPRAQAQKLGGTIAKVTVENQTGYELTVRYSGPDSKKLIIPKGMTKSVSLYPGDYKVAASVNASNVTNYYGADSMRGGQYSSNFYIKSGSGF